MPFPARHFLGIPEESIPHSGSAATTMPETVDSLLPL